MLTPRKWLVLNWLIPGCLRAEDIPYSATQSTSQAIDDRLSELDHEKLDTLTHDLAEDNYTEYTRTSGRVVGIVSWTDSGKTVKIRSEDLTYTSGRVTRIVERQFDQLGALAATKTTDITRSGGVVSSEDITMVYA